MGYTYSCSRLALLPTAFPHTLIRPSAEGLNAGILIINNIIQGVAEYIKEITAGVARKKSVFGTMLFYFT